jgi:hypothetical protein
MRPDLTDDDKAILVELLRETIERDRFPMSPRIRSFKAILRSSNRPRRDPNRCRRRSHRASGAWRYRKSSSDKRCITTASCICSATRRSGRPYVRST